MPTLELVVPVDHPAFPGHFPGRPIVPGVVLLDLAQLAVEDASGQRVGGIAQAKFLSPLGPGEALWLDWEPDGRFTLRAAGRKVATGRFNLRPSSPANQGPA